MNIILEKKDRIATIILNRPGVLNALDLQTFLDLEKVISDVASDNKISAAIITGADRAFCAGIDLSYINKISSMSLHGFQKELRKFQEIFNSIENLEKPVIAAINGFALGAGLDLALACDLRIASEKAMLGEQYIKVGLMPDLGGTQRLPRIIGITKAKELIFTGDMIDGKEAERIGLVNKAVTPEKTLSTAQAMAEKLAQGPTIAIGMAKKAINKSLGTDIKNGLEYEVFGQSICIQTEDYKEGVRAFLEKRSPSFKGK